MGDPSDGEAPKAWHSRVRGKPSKVSSRRRNEFHGSRSKGVHKKSVREVRGGLSADEDDDDAAKEPMPDETAALVSSTNTLTTETFSEEELHLRQKCKRPSLLKGKQWTSVSSKIHSLKQRTPLHDGTTVRFVFQRPRTRIDWRSLHAVDVEQIFRETDIHKLESILETIAFGDVLGEDTRNFTEQNFLKLFRLSQLMIEYLLHVQETLASDKQKLLVAGESLQKRGEKLQVQCLWQYDALKRTRRELKHAKKTLNTYEMVLRTNGKVSSFQQVHHCPLCEKLFESSRFLDQHITRRHPKSMNQITEDKILEIVSKAEEATAARVKSETTLMLQAELQHLRAASQVDSQKDEADLHLETGRSHHGKEKMEQKKSKQHWRNLEMKFNDVELHLKKINHENSRLKKELEQTNCEVITIILGITFSSILE
ncbi:hypothetical protein O6H91_02G124700 [Diphasiastrum complanatum]|uniref:Uncharacterized protein n=1 Tax=Diphasiastrum complanatum TaxID=34168 RepID=A0ACC2EKE5_DIPCM|nr:hypothetical protein O6H91_02G124700 [Diphasiastrum complanatum]